MLVTEPYKKNRGNPESKIWRDIRPDGQPAVGIHEIQPAAQIVEHLHAGFDTRLAAFGLSAKTCTA